MCWPNCCKCNKDPLPLFDEDGSIVEDTSNELIIPDTHEHVDSVYLNFDIEDGILGFIYETSHGAIIVWTSQEAQDLCAYYTDLFFELNA